jgi:hypothetical protein
MTEAPKVLREGQTFLTGYDYSIDKGGLSANVPGGYWYERGL